MENYPISSILNLNITGTRGNYHSIVNGMSWEAPLHSNPENKFYFIIEGDCTITIDGKEYIGKPGSWFFIPADVEHCYRNNSNFSFEMYWLHFEVFPSNKEILSLNLPYMVKTNNGLITELFSEFVHTPKSTISGALQVKSVVFRLLAEYIKIFSENIQQTIAVSNKKLNDILKYFRNNMDKNISINEAAEKFYMRPSHFIRFFKKNTGLTPAKFIKKQKLMYAKTYLEQTDMSIAQILEKVGESNLSSFSKQFKAEYSVSPRKYRDMYIKNKYKL